MISNLQKFNLSKLNKLPINNVFKINQTTILNPDELIEKIDFRIDLQVLEQGEILARYYFSVKGIDHCGFCGEVIPNNLSSELIIVFGTNKTNNKQAKKVSKGKFKKSGRETISNNTNLEPDYLINNSCIDLIKPMLDEFYLEQPITKRCDICQKNSLLKIEQI